MNQDNPIVHPYIPNSVPAVKQQLLETVGAGSVDEFYQDVPDRLRLKEPWTCLSRSCPSMPCGATSRASWPETRPARRPSASWAPAATSITSGRVRRDQRPREFLTAYAGEPYEDHGRFQALSSIPA